jgi:WD40 repeat protein
MAPEQAEGKAKEAGPAADIYALGAILYQLLTGRPPFKAATPWDTMLQVVSEPVIPPSHHARRVPADLEAVCLKCLEKRPARRYATAQALAEDLDRFLGGLPTLARLPRSRRAGLSQVLQAKLTRALGPRFTAVMFLAGLGLVLASVVLGCWSIFCTGERRDLGVLYNVTFSPDSRILAGATWASRVSLWDTQTGSVLHEDPSPVEGEEPYRGLPSLAFAPNGATLAVDTFEGTDFWHLKAQTRATTEIPPADQANDMAADKAHTWGGDWHADVRGFVDDGNAFVRAYGGATRLWDVQTGREKLHGKIRGLLSPDGRTIAVQHADGAVTLQDLRTGRLEATLQGRQSHSLMVGGEPVPFLPKWRATFLSSQWRATFLSSAERGEFAAVECAPSGPTWCWSRRGPNALVSPHGFIARRGKTGSIELSTWRVDRDHPLTSELEQHPGHGLLEYSPQGKALVTLSDRAVTVWSTSSGKRLVTLERARAFLFGPGDETLLVLGESGGGTLWELAGPRQRVVWPDFAQVPLHVQFSPDGRTLLTGGAGNELRLWDTASGKPRGGLLQSADWTRPEDDFMVATVFTPDSRLLLTVATASNGGDLVAEAWDVATAERRGRVQGYEIVALSPDGKLLVTSEPEPDNKVVGKHMRLWSATWFWRHASFRRWAARLLPLAILIGVVGMWLTRPPWKSPRTAAAEGVAPEPTPPEWPVAATATAGAPPSAPAALQRMAAEPVTEECATVVPAGSTVVPQTGTSGAPEFAEYDILEELGRGAMGVVYRARHVPLQRLVALKMVLAGAHATPEELERFRMEAEAVARLQHPNIVQIYAVG